MDFAAFVFYLFGRGVSGDPPIELVKWVFRGNRPEDPNGFGLNVFPGRNQFVTEAEATNFQDLVVTCNAAHFTSESEEIEIARADGTTYFNRFYFDN